MKRFHIHVAVDDLAANIRFYSAMFGAQPAVTKPDYAKWMIEDPRINFAISSRGMPAGIDHIGFQVDSADELQALRAQVDAAEIAASPTDAANCCYAKSEKYWITDPQGVAWETYHTLDSIPTFGADTGKAVAKATEVKAASACCAPAPAKVAISSITVKQRAA